MSTLAQTTAVVVVAAGRGTRAGNGPPKQWRPLAGRRVIDHCLETFLRAGVARIVVVTHADDSAEPLPNSVTRVTGGRTRAASVLAGLEALADDPPDCVLIHDAARATVPLTVIQDVIQALETHTAAAPGLRVTDALWQEASDGTVAKTVDRTGLARAQTPQGFHFDRILAAHRAAPAPDASDDVEIARQAGMAVQMTPGHEDNLKITTPQDFDRAERILQER